MHALTPVGAFVIWDRLDSRRGLTLAVCMEDSHTVLWCQKLDTWIISCLMRRYSSWIFACGSQLPLTLDWTGVVRLTSCSPVTQADHNSADHSQHSNNDKRKNCCLLCRHSSRIAASGPQLPFATGWKNFVWSWHWLCHACSTSLHC